ncbi:MAG: hypothetical protein EA378_09360 [Phycisphaerales bacterium]|nr:MAG: hypothetical protein EA378_09360 [Phycisphaerales bacterium]
MAVLQPQNTGRGAWSAMNVYREQITEFSPEIIQISLGPNGAWVGWDTRTKDVVGGRIDWEADRQDVAFRVQLNFREHWISEPWRSWEPIRRAVWSTCGRYAIVENGAILDTETGKPISVRQRWGRPVGLLTSEQMPEDAVVGFYAVPASKSSRLLKVLIREDGQGEWNARVSRVSAQTRGMSPETMWSSPTADMLFGYVSITPILSNFDKRFDIQTAPMVQNGQFVPIVIRLPAAGPDSADISGHIRNQVFDGWVRCQCK